MVECIVLFLFILQVLVSCILQILDRFYIIIFSFALGLTVGLDSLRSVTFSVSEQLDRHTDRHTRARFHRI